MFCSDNVEVTNSGFRILQIVFCKTPISINVVCVCESSWIDRNVKCWIAQINEPTQKHNRFGECPRWYKAFWFMLIDQANIVEEYRKTNLVTNRRMGRRKKIQDNDNMMVSWGWKLKVSLTDDGHTGVGVKNGKMWEFSQVGDTCSYHSFKEHNQPKN